MAGVLALVLGLLLALPAAAQEAERAFDRMRSGGAGFAEVLPETALRFPEDHGAHPGFRIEWWYVTANLRDAEGAPLGLQWTLFRFATRPGGAADAGWATPQIWMGHAAVTTAEAHRAAERLARGGIGQAGVATDPFAAWIDDWVFAHAGAGGAGAFSPLRLAARGEGFAYDVTLAAEGPMVLQGEAGYSVKSAVGQASHYASQPFFAVEGWVEVAGTRRQVTGRAWMDREWSSRPLAGSQSGWDWFSLHLSGGEKLMVYRLRDSARGDYVTGNWIAPDGTSTRLAPGAVRLAPLARAEVAEGREMTVRWRIEIPARGLAVETRPLNPRAWNGLSTAYWEGPVFVEGSHAGEGYLEMTGE
ncbi:lipocalin-like domain-containing protein [Paralimibaculum aggregatum]|uniref:Lipocalin-like domain-containing protein n=1 Tax=Paralimibaculum aggregatum TaxID=3036245 RepID=A0ABQ6LD66_9RHOB|nr:lipocalin-like domain-containing protein [Limibaculum sp. NKW23]GMG80922.1 lipocalin-like domain-containing protein [Limibaculum sp. NKW23]